MRATALLLLSALVASPAAAQVDDWHKVQTPPLHKIPVRRPVRVEAPDRPVVPPHEGRHDSPVRPDVAGGIEIQRALARRASRVIEREVARIYATDVEGERVVVDVHIERRICE